MAISVSEAKGRDSLDTSFRVDHHEIESRAREFLNRRAAVGLAVGVLDDGQLVVFSGHEVVDIASGTPVTEVTVLRIGLITTAVAAMQSVSTTASIAGPPMTLCLAGAQVPQSVPCWCPSCRYPGRISGRPISRHHSFRQVVTERTTR